MALRARLLLVVLVLLTAGLLVSGVATTRALRSYLLNRVDDQLKQAEPVAVRRLAGQQTFGPRFPGNGGGDGGPGAGGPGGVGTGEISAARIDPSGGVVEAVTPPFYDDASPFTGLPKAALAPARQGKQQYVNLRTGGQTYRAIVEPLGLSDDVAVIMSPLDDVNATVHRLQRVDLGVSILLVVVAAGLGFWLVRVGLRPLDEMVDTADAIALGDIDRRIDASGGGREVVRLAHALNGAFDARQTSEETLRQFVADASHELRTPLTSIRGYAELLRAGAVPDAEDADRAVRRIEAEAARMGVLVEDLLLLARMDQGRPLRREQVDLTIVAADAAADAKAVEPDRPVTLSAREPVLVTGDEARLRQVLSNLLANVRDHTPAGTPVDVSVRREGEAGVVEVADHGPGIPADAAEHAFDRFWRVDPARTHRTGAAGGAGLGLSIVAAIAAAHGGKVALSTTPGGGATLTVTIPCTLPEDGPSAPSAASTDGPPAATGSPPDAAG